MAGRLEGRRIAFLTANEGVEQVELTAPWDAVRDEGGEPVLLAPEMGRLKYRLIGIGVADLLDGAGAAGDLFAGDENRARRSETAVDALRAKYGAAAVVSARALRREAEE